MIITLHLLAGAAIASRIQNPVIGLILAFLSHYFLDFIPHNEYSIKNIREKNWRQSFPDFLKLFLDFSFGILIILIFSENKPIIFVGAILAIVPDFLTFLSLISNRFPKLAKEAIRKHLYFHQNIVQFIKNKKIPVFWRILSQILIVFLAIFLLL